MSVGQERLNWTGTLMSLALCDQAHLAGRAQLWRWASFCRHRAGRCCSHGSASHLRTQSGSLHSSPHLGCPADLWAGRVPAPQEREAQIVFLFQNSSFLPLPQMSALAREAQPPSNFAYCTTGSLCFLAWAHATLNPLISNVYFSPYPPGPGYMDAAVCLRAVNRD